MPTGADTTVLYIAALASGAVLVPVVHIYGHAELGFILRESRARFLAVPRRWQQIDFIERVRNCGELPSLERLIVVYLDRWDAALAAALIERYRVRLSGGTPFHFQAVLEAARRDGRDLSSLAAFNQGGTGVTPDHVCAVDAAGTLGSRTYGLTEHSTVSVGWIDLPADDRACTDGRVQPGTEVRIIRRCRTRCGTGSGRRDSPARARAVRRLHRSIAGPAVHLPGAWFRPGDIGRLDERGLLTITDRKKDIIIRGGENISSLEVEQVLARHLAVAVVAMPDLRLGEKVCAFVVPRNGCTIALQDVQAHFMAAGVARQKSPEALHLVDELPRTPSGKVMKAELRRRLRDATAR